MSPRLTHIALGETHRERKFFTAVDFVKLGMSRGEGQPLELPVISSVVKPIIDQEVAQADAWMLQNSIDKGYIYLARYLSSTAGNRAQLTGVYATPEVMVSILNAGGLSLSKHNVFNTNTYGGGYPDQSPVGPGGETYKYFIFYKYSDRNNEVIKNFGVVPLTGQKW